MEDFIPLLLSAILLVSFIGQLYYLIANSGRLRKYVASPNNAGHDLSVSVIISARNEHDNLIKNLPLILKQNYPDFEVVVINDRSYDGSEVILEEFEKLYDKLKVVTISEHDRYKRGKKFALTLGIKAAKNEHLLFTDADCEPASDEWIRLMVQNFSNTNIQLVLGYSPYKKKPGILNAFIRFETFKTATSFLSAALRGNAYMGLGRNLCYTKTLFFKNKGFASHMHILAGDDDLFVNQNATPDNVAIEIDEDAHIWTESKNTFGEYIRQKRRHMGVGKFYKGKHRRFLSFDALSGLLFYSMLIALLCLSFQPWIVLGVFVLRCLLQVLLYNKLFKRLKCGDLVWWAPVFDLVYYLYLNLFGLIGTFSKTKQWK